MVAKTDSSRSVRVALIAVLLLSTAVFWRTAYPTITWWDSSSYSLAAATIGLTSSPGSLLLTLIGWPIAKLPLGTPAYLFNLTAGVIAALAAALLYLVALRVGRNAGAATSGTRAVAAAIGAALGALMFAFSPTLWEHAVKFTPYVLTAVFTALILMTMVRWWEVAEDPDAWRWLALLAFLFGLDFSVHRTNSLLIPGAIAWVLVRHPVTFQRPRSWLVAAAGMVAGLSVQLLVMPISALTQSPLNSWEPNTWARFWDYVSLAQTGGGFLIEVWPRKSPFWSSQVADVLRVLRENVAHVSTRVGFFGLLLAIVGVVGIVVLWRRNRRLCGALALVAVLHLAMTVIYFNIPANYFRSLDRHYLPVLVTLSVFVIYGSSVAAEWLAELAASGKRIVAVAVAAMLLMAPATQLVGQWATHDASARRFTRDFAVNALAALPKDAIYFTVGDNDTFPVWYLQAVESVRPDVQIINLSLANTTWYIDQIVRRDSTFPISLGKEAFTRPERWRGLAITLPAAGASGAITVRMAPLGGGEMVASDVVLFDIVRTNAWRRPITFAITAGNIGWLAPYARLEGLYWRVLPTSSPPSNRETLRANLFDRYEYRGYADSSVVIDNETRTMGYQYLLALKALVDADAAAGESARCADTVRRFIALVPPDRLQLGDAFRADRLCQN